MASQHGPCLNEMQPDTQPANVPAACTTFSPTITRTEAVRGAAAGAAGPVA